MSRIRPFRRALLAVLAIPAAASAQSSTAQARALDQFLGTSCLATSTLTGAASSSCLLPVQSGSVTSSGASDNSLLSVSALASTTQTDVNHILAAFAEGTGIQDNTLFVTGTSGVNDRLVFHFSTNTTSLFTGIFDPTTTATLGLFVFDPSFNSSYSQVVANSSSNVGSGKNYLLTPAGVDLTLGFDSFTGAYFYEMMADAFVIETYSMFGNTTTAFFSGSIDATLTGIDDVDMYGNIRASAMFAGDGSATMDIVTTTTPEPGSLALVGTGLLGVFVKRRRQKQPAPSA